jgi:hypothetical protein
MYDGYQIEERTPLALGAAAQTAICENTGEVRLWDRNKKRPIRK